MLELLDIIPSYMVLIPPMADIIPIFFTLVLIFGYS